MTRAEAFANPTHIYVIGFSDGVVKVGRTSNLTTRLRMLKSDAGKRGATIERRWASAHPDARGAEFHLRVVGRGFFTRAWGGEYFTADFDEFMGCVETKFTDYRQPIGEVVDFDTLRPASRGSE